MCNGKNKARHVSFIMFPYSVTLMKMFIIKVDPRGFFFNSKEDKNMVTFTLLYLQK